VNSEVHMFVVKDQGTARLLNYWTILIHEVKDSVNSEKAN
jgi:hypothetical protein